MEDGEDEDEELLLLRIKALKSTTRVNINVEFTSDSDNDVSVSKKKKTKEYFKKHPDKKTLEPKNVQNEHGVSSGSDDEENLLREIALSSLQKKKSQSAIQHDLISSTSGEQGNTNSSLEDPFNQSAIIDFAIERPVIPSVSEVADHDTSNQVEMSQNPSSVSSPTTLATTVDMAVPGVVGDQTTTATAEEECGHVESQTTSTATTTEEGCGNVEGSDDVLSLCASDKDESELAVMLLPTVKNHPNEPTPSDSICPPTSAEELNSNDIEISLGEKGDASVAGALSSEVKDNLCDEDQPGPSGYIKPTIIHGYDSESEESLIDTTPCKDVVLKNGEPGSEMEVAACSVGANEDESDVKDSKDLTCSVCLGPFENRSFLNFCFHSFCYACIMQWSEISRLCPLCKSKYTSLIHSVNNDLDYETYEFPTDVATQPDTTTASRPREFSEVMDDGRRFRYQSTMVDPEDFLRRQREQAQQSTTTDARRMKRRVKWCGAKNTNVRNLVYKKGYKISEVKQKGKPKVREISPKFFTDNPALKHRLVPWLLRDLYALLGDDDESIRFVMSLILRVISTISMTGAPFREQLRPFLFEQTDIFVDELISFARSPYDIRGYDANVRYEKDNDIEITGVTQPLIHLSDTESPPTNNEDTQHSKLLHEVFIADQEGEGPLAVNNEGADSPFNNAALPIEEVEPERLFVTVQNDVLANVVVEGKEDCSDIDDDDDDEQNANDGSRKRKKVEKKKKVKHKKRKSKEEKVLRKKKGKKDKVKETDTGKGGEVEIPSGEEDTMIAIPENSVNLVKGDESASFLLKDSSELEIEHNSVISKESVDQLVSTESKNEDAKKIKKEDLKKRRKKLADMEKKTKRKYKNLKHSERMKVVEKKMKRKHKKRKNISGDEEKPEKEQKTNKKRTDSSSGEDMETQEAKDDKKVDKLKVEVSVRQGEAEVTKSKDKNAKKLKKKHKEKRRRKHSSSDEDIGNKEVLEKGDAKKRSTKSEKTPEKPKTPEKQKNHPKEKLEEKKSLKRKSAASEGGGSAEKKKKKDKAKDDVDSKRTKEKTPKKKHKEKRKKGGKVEEKEKLVVPDKELRTKIDKIRLLMNTNDDDDDDDDFLNSDEVKDLLSRYKSNGQKDLIKDGDAYRTRSDMVRELLLIEKAITKRKEKKKLTQVKVVR